MWAQYFISLLNMQLFYGFLDNYAASKDSIQSEFGLSDTFFGLLDMFSLIFRCVLAAYMIIHPFKKLKTANFVLAILQFIGSVIMSSSHFIPIYHKFLLIFGISLTGIGRGNISMIYLVSYQNIKGGQNEKAFNIWTSLTRCGTAHGLLLALLFIYTLGLNWSISFLIYNLMFLLNSFTFFMTLQDVQISQQNRSIVNTLRQLKLYYGKQHSNWLLLLDYILLFSFDLIQIIWAPFFFSKLGYIQASVYIPLSIPAGTLLGSITILLILNQYYRHRSIITISLAVINLIIMIAILSLGDDPIDILYYFLLFFMIFLISTGPQSLILGSQLSQKVSQTEQRYLVMSFMRLCMQLFTAIMMVVIGVIMDIGTQQIISDDRNFLYFSIFNLALYLVIHIARRIIEYKENSVQQGYYSIN